MPVIPTAVTTNKATPYSTIEAPLSSLLKASAFLIKLVDMCIFSLVAPSKILTGLNILSRGRYFQQNRCQVAAVIMTMVTQRSISR